MTKEIVTATEADLAKELTELRALKTELSAKLAEIEEAQTRPSAQSSAFTKQDLAEVLQSNTDATRKALRPENNDMTPKGVFNPTGGVKTKLTRKTVFVGAQMYENQLTPAEIDLFNRFTTNKEARNGRWTAKFIKNGTTEELHIGVPHMEISDRMELPSLSLILRELLDGADAANPDFLAERLSSLERQLAHTA